MKPYFFVGNLMNKYTNTTLFIIDGSSFLYRAYYGLRPLHTPQGEAVQAVYGFCRMIKKLIDRFDPKNMVLVWDSKGPTKRHAIFPDYKATRQVPPSDLFDQKEHIIEFAQSIGLAQDVQVGIEADDLMYSLALAWTDQHPENTVVIITSDKDMGQVITSKITLFDAFKDVFVDEVAFIEAMGFEPRKTTFYFSVVGDSSDNIPGVKGIGKKGALELVQQFDSLSDAYNRLESIESKRLKTALQDHKDDAFLSEKLFILHRYPVDFTKLNVQFVPSNWANARAIFTALQFTSLLKELPVEYRQQPLFFAPLYINESTSHSFITIATQEALEELINQIKKYKLFAYDTECIGLSPLATTLVGVSICLAQGTSYYIPCGHVTQEPQLPRELVIEWLRPIFEDPAIGKIAHHAKFDQLVLAQCDIHVQGTIFDTMIAASLVKEEWQRVSLKDLSQTYLGQQMLTYEQMVTDKKLKDFSYVTVSDATRYAAADAHQTFSLHPLLEKQLQEKNMQKLYQEIELPLVQVLTDMEERGIFCDVAVLKELDAVVTEQLEQLRTTILGLIDPSYASINLNSPRQIEDLLFNGLQLPRGKKSDKRTSYSTDSEVLTELKKIHPVPAYILQYRELFKLKSTYIDALPTFINSHTGRIHTTFIQHRVATGRLASTDPNLQNIPVQGIGRQVRAAFKAQEDHRVLISADYSQIELRVLAYLCQDSALVDAFIQGKDIHRQTAAGIFEVPVDQVTDEQRSLGKRINFSILYGLTPYGLSKDLDISLKDAKRFIDAYFAQYIQVRVWMDQVIERAKVDGYVTTWYGRRRDVPGVRERNKNLYELGCRIAINTVVQGTSAEIMKLGMLRVNEYLKNKSDAHMILQIHDQLLIECDRNQVEIVEKEVKQQLETVTQWNVPLEVATGIGRNWKDAE